MRRKRTSMAQSQSGTDKPVPARSKRSVVRARQTIRRFLFEPLEQRILLAADLSYPDTNLASDYIVRVVSGGASPVVQLLESSTSAVVNSVSLDSASDVQVNVRRQSATGADIRGDTIRIDTPSFSLLNTFVADKGGLFTVNFDGGLDINASLPLPIADDTLRIEGSGAYSLGYSFVVLSTSDIVIAAGSPTFTGSFTAKSLATNIGKSDATDPTKFISIPHTSITIGGGSLRASSISLEATSTVNVTIDRTTALGGQSALVKRSWIPLLQSTSPETIQLAERGWRQQRAPSR